MAYALQPGQSGLAQGDVTLVLSHTRCGKVAGSEALSLASSTSTDAYVVVTSMMPALLVQMVMATRVGAAESAACARHARDALGVAVGRRWNVRVVLGCRSRLAAVCTRCRTMGRVGASGAGGGDAGLAGSSPSRTFPGRLARRGVSHRNRGHDLRHRGPVLVRGVRVRGATRKGLVWAIISPAVLALPAVGFLQAISFGYLDGLLDHWLWFDRATSVLVPLAGVGGLLFTIPALRPDRLQRAVWSWSLLVAIVGPQLRRFF